MSQTEITNPLKKYDALLRSSHVALLTTIRHNDGLLSTNPVGFVWDGECIRISTLKSRIKYKNLAANPMVTFCLISPKNIMSYIEVRGHATLEDDADRSFCRTQFMAGSNGQEPPADLDPPEAERAIIKIHPQQVSSPTLYGGRFDRK
ncbi:MAG TPA: PPOX class F420-dependent oxidoreductase [Spongiibacteraceae bacterium]|nr:PPOX class F420-dependent oxidoreductase [Spongiibacteraceae bacterium]